MIVNGMKIEGKELDKWRKERESRHASNMKGIIESRRAPGGHSTVWAGGGHESISTALPESQAVEHLEFLIKKGVVGVELKPIGNGLVAPTTSSASAKREYLAAIGRVDVSGCNLNVDQDKTKRRMTAEDHKKAAIEVRNNNPDKTRRLKCLFDQMAGKS